MMIAASSGLPDGSFAVINFFILLMTCQLWRPLEVVFCSHSCARIRDGGTREGKNKIIIARGTRNEVKINPNPIVSVYGPSTERRRRVRMVKRWSKVGGGGGSPV
jgi:hypothetical protein